MLEITNDMIYGLLFVFGNIGLTFSVCAYLVYLLQKYNLLSYTRVDKFEHLKNALFTIALIVIYNDSIGDNDAYEEYDGTELPPLTGADPVNALISYMYPGHTGTMYNKYLAVKRFIDNHLCGDQQQEVFVMQFLDTLNNYIEKANTPDIAVPMHDSDTEEVVKDVVHEDGYHSADTLKED
jgi:hypothetical protein